MPRIRTQYDFTSGIFSQGDLLYNRFEMSIDFYTLNGTPEDQNTALDRMTYFIYDVVQHSMFIHEDDFDQINLLTSANIPLLTIADPGPFDPIILATLITKMNVITEDVIVITDAEITSQLSGNVGYIWDAADEEDEIHEIVNDTDLPKWWAAPQPRFGSYPDGVDVKKLEKTSPFPLSWKDVGLPWADEYTEEDLTTVIDAVKNPGKIIKANFKPPTKK